MNEFHRDVLSSGGVRSSSEGQQAASAQETLGHLAAGLGQTRGLAREKLFESPVATKQALFDSTAPVKGRHQARASGLFANFADHLRFASTRRQTQGIDRGIGIVRGDDRQ